MRKIGAQPYETQETPALTGWTFGDHIPPDCRFGHQVITNADDERSPYPVGAEFARPTRFTNLVLGLTRRITNDDYFELDFDHPRQDWPPPEVTNGF